MADSDFLVTISGPALSLLFYENVRNCGNQMGFLLGETLEFVVKTHTDLDNQIETVKRYNNIQTIVTCPVTDSIHNSIGRVDKEKLKEFLRNKSKQVIGWFSFRQNLSLAPTFRERILHKEFASYFFNDNDVKEEFFVACLLSSSTSSEGGTHKFKHVFLRQKKQTFEPVPLRISNLGSKLFSHDRSDYKPTPTKKSSDVSDVFSALIESWNLDLTKASSIECVDIIQRAAEQYLSQLIPKLCKSDLEVAELERQIKELNLKLKLRIIDDDSNDLSQLSETEKNVHTNDVKQTSSNICPPRTESTESSESSASLNDVQNPALLSVKGQSVKAHQEIPAHKPRQLKHVTACTEKGVNLSNSKNTSTDTMNSESLEPPRANSVSEMKIDITENISNKIRRPTIIESEIVKESICKGETNASGIGRGRGKLMSDASSELKIGRRNSSSIAARNSSERISHTEVLQQESSQADSVQSTSSQQASYSQVTKKKVINARKSDATDNH